MAQDDGVTVIRICKHGFVPAVVSIVGAEDIIFFNEDDVVHAPESDLRSRMAGAWEFTGIAPGKAGVLYCPPAGEWPYHCRLHPQMSGKITVNDSRTGP